MAIIKEWRCKEHGEFESRFAVCPNGCVSVDRIHTRAPATVSRRTKNIDATLSGIASDYKLSDISNKNGSLANSVDKYKPAAEADPAMQKYIQSKVGAFGGRMLLPGSTVPVAMGATFTALISAPNPADHIPAINTAMTTMLGSSASLTQVSLGTYSTYT